MKSEYRAQRFPAQDAGCPAVFLKQGEYYVSDSGPAMVTTVLGSCVTVTMHCQGLKIGGITHSLLPYPLPGINVPYGHHGRFVNVVIPHVFERLLALGVKKSGLEVKVFGGGQMLIPASDTAESKVLNIGRRNVETALKVIQELGLSITATDVGGTCSRRVFFFPHQGDVWIRKVRRSIEKP